MLFFTSKKIVFPKTTVFIKFFDPSLTMVNIIVNNFFTRSFFQKQSFLKINRIKNGRKSFLKNDRFHKRSLFVF